MAISVSIHTTPISSLLLRTARTKNFAVSRSTIACLTSHGDTTTVKATNSPAYADAGLDYKVSSERSGAGNAVVRLMRSTESTIEKVIFDFRFLALLAVGGSLAGSLLCFLNGLISRDSIVLTLQLYILSVNIFVTLIVDSSIRHVQNYIDGPKPFYGHVQNYRMKFVDQLIKDYGEEGCVYIVDAYKVYWGSCVKGVHTGQMVLRLVEAIDVYLAGTVMMIFGMGLYGLFISNVPPDVPTAVDRSLKGSSLFGMFALKERPKWMKISSLDELKTKVGHVIVMILLVKMFERSKMVTIATGLDLLSYSVCIFLSSASLYILHNLHKSD